MEFCTESNTFMIDLHTLNIRLEAAINIKELWLQQYLEVYRYVTPNRDDRNLYGGYTQDNKQRTQMIYDSTAMTAANQRANELQGLILPAGRDWGNYVENKLVSKKPIPSADIFSLNAVINKYIQASDLQIGAAGSFLDLTIGMGALWIESKSDDVPLSYKAVSSLSVYPEFTSENVIDTAWTKHAMTARQILENYPKYQGNKRLAMEAKLDEPTFIWIGQVKDKGEYLRYGVLDEDNNLINQINSQNAESILENVSGGMKTKVITALKSAGEGIKQVIIASGLRENPILKALNNENCTIITD